MSLYVPLLAVLNFLNKILPFFTTDEEIINQIKGTNQALSEIKELLKQQVRSKLKCIVCPWRSGVEDIC